MAFEARKEKFLMCLKNKRYSCGAKYVILRKIPTWPEYAFSKFLDSSEDGIHFVFKDAIHTVGHFGENPHLLKSCYTTSSNVAMEYGCRTVAFHCISTGIYHYPIDNAAHVALATVQEWLEKNQDAINRVVCLFLEEDIEVYEKVLPQYFLIRHHYGFLLGQCQF